MPDIQNSISGAETAVDYEAQAQALEAEAKRLATLPAAQRAVERKGVAKRFGTTVAVLEALIKQFLPDDKENGRNGSRLVLSETNPWHEKVDGAALLNDLSRAIREYIVMPAVAADASALWVGHTHALDACHYSPRLFITSPDKRCGKSQLLKILGKASARPLNAGSISAASVYRTVQAVHPTLLVDEFDAHNKEDEEMRKTINNGYERGNVTIRTDPNTLEVLQFDTFAPVAIAAIGRTWATVEDRSITIRLHRKRTSEKVKKMRRNHAPEFDCFASKAARWATDNLDAIASADPECPGALNDRAADIWTPLFAIADLAGGDWPARARQSALALSADGAMEEQTIGAILLADLRNLLDEQPEDGFATREIRDHLGTLEERPWPAYGRARKPISAKQIADILKPYEVYSTTLRTAVGTAKGYRRSDLKQAIDRYLPLSPVTTLQPAENSEKSEISSRNKLENVTGENSQKPAESLGCNVVTGENAKFAPVCKNGAGGIALCTKCGASLDTQDKGITWLTDNGQAVHKGACPNASKERTVLQKEGSL